MGLFLRGSLGKDAIEIVGFRVEFEWTLGDELWQEFVFSLDLFWIERPKTTHDFYGDRLGHGLFLSTSNFWTEKFDFSTISHFLEWILMEYIGMKPSLDFRLQIYSIHSIRIRSRNKDILEKPKPTNLQ